MENRRKMLEKYHRDHDGCHRSTVNAYSSGADPIFGISSGLRLPRHLILLMVYPVVRVYLDILTPNWS
jgi:hypothetical protein